MELRCLNCIYLLALIWALVGINAEPLKFDIDGSSIREAGELESEHSQLSDSSLLWGPYRSALYFGLRPRIPKSLLSGLMWFNVDDFGSIGKIRHFYEQGDNMRRANWIYYDPRTGGRQVIDDVDSHIKIIIDFVKSTDGNSWGVKIRAKTHKGFESTKTSFVWYSGLEGQKLENGVLVRDGYMNFENKKDSRGYKGTVKLTGLAEGLGLFDLEIGDGPTSNKHPKEKNKRDPDLDPSRLHYLSLTVPDDKVWRARDIFMTILQESVEDLVSKHENLESFPPEQALLVRDIHKFEGNLHFFQKIYEGNCEFDIVFKSALTPAPNVITFENIGDKIKTSHSLFEAKFKEHFPLSAPFNSSKKHEKFAKEMLSGLLGGLSYFHGDHLVDRETVFDEDSFESYVLNGVSEGPHELFTLVPSRPFFPRGFLWDEGFHLLPLLKYDSDLALEIVKSWFSLSDADGWIAREQILGPELRSRVPEQFQVQSPEIVNPPTLMLVFTYLLENLQASATFGDVNTPIDLDEVVSTANNNNPGLILVNNHELLIEYTKNIYPKLKTHFEWFRRTQKGYIEEFDRGEIQEGYRWRGRTLSHCLASGLDDYPRALPADVAELNVDLLSWVGVMARSMKMIAKLIDFDSDFLAFEKIELDIIENLDKLHWSEEKSTYCDLSVDDEDENVYVCHKGYISLFPFLTKLIPEDDTDKIKHIVDLIANPDELWTEYGIRSLSKADEYYRTNENYWRSPIWININYLVLESLQHYKEVSAKHLSKDLEIKIGETYKQLRLNLVNNVFKQWEKTGFVWEQYDDETGASKGAKNFLGWTSTVILMMKMPESI